MCVRARARQATGEMQPRECGLFQVQTTDKLAETCQDIGYRHATVKTDCRTNNELEVTKRAMELHHSTR